MGVPCSKPLEAHSQCRAVLAKCTQVVPLGRTGNISWTARVYLKPAFKYEGGKLRTIEAFVGSVISDSLEKRFAREIFALSPSFFVPPGVQTTGREGLRGDVLRRGQFESLRSSCASVCERRSRCIRERILIDNGACFGHGENDNVHKSSQRVGRMSVRWQTRFTGKPCAGDLRGVVAKWGATNPLIGAFCCACDFVL